MELHRLEAICDIVRSAADQRSTDPGALAASLHRQGVTDVELAEALNDVGRLPRGVADEMGGLLRLTLERVSDARPAPRRRSAADGATESRSP